MPGFAAGSLRGKFAKSHWPSRGSPESYASLPMPLTQTPSILQFLVTAKDTNPWRSLLALGVVPIRVWSWSPISPPDQPLTFVMIELELNRVPSPTFPEMSSEDRNLESRSSILNQYRLGPSPFRVWTLILWMTLSIWSLPKRRQP